MLCSIVCCVACFLCWIICCVCLFFVFDCMLCLIVVCCVRLYVAAAAAASRVSPTPSQDSSTSQADTASVDSSSQPPEVQFSFLLYPLFVYPWEYWINFPSGKEPVFFLCDTTLYTTLPLGLGCFLRSHLCT